MKILVVPRKWFAEMRRTSDEERVMAEWNVISINTPAYEPGGFEEEGVPFSPQYADQPNVLTLKFHDADTAAEGVTLMTAEDAARIHEFVDSRMDEGRGFIVHCTAGVSRSQAVGLALNEYVNAPDGRMPDPEEYENYDSTHRTGSANLLVKGLLMREFGLMPDFFFGTEV